MRAIVDNNEAVKFVRALLPSADGADEPGGRKKIGSPRASSSYPRRNDSYDLRPRFRSPSLWSR